MEKPNLSYLFHKNFFYEMSIEELRTQYCINTCWEGDLETYCENCQKCYQDWTKTKLDNEKNNEPTTNEFYFDKWHELREFLKPKCMKICNNDRGNKLCSNCAYIKLDFLKNIEKICFCEECYLKYKTEYVENNLAVEGLSYELLMQCCDICDNFICPHYFSLKRLCDYCIFNDMIDKKYQIRKYIDNLAKNLHQKYMPGGMGFTDAQNHFNDIHNDSQKTDK